MNTKQRIKNLENFENFLVDLAKEITKSSVGYVKRRNKTITIDKRGRFIIYKDDLKGGKHRFGKSLNKKQTLTFLLEVFNAN